MLEYCLRCLRFPGPSSPKLSYGQIVSHQIAIADRYVMNGRMCAAIGDENRPSPGHEDFGISYVTKLGNLESGGFSIKSYEDLRKKCGKGRMDDSF